MVTGEADGSRFVCNARVEFKIIGCNAKSRMWPGLAMNELK